MAAICEDLPKFQKFVPQLITEALDAVYGNSNIPNITLIEILKMFNEVMAKATSIGIDRKTLNSEAVRAQGRPFAGIKERWTVTILW